MLAPHYSMLNPKNLIVNLLNLYENKSQTISPLFSLHDNMYNEEYIRFSSEL